MAELSDADELTRGKLSAALRKRKTWIYIGLLALAGLLFGSTGGVASALFFFVAALLIGLAGAWAVASSDSADAFFDSYARSRGLALEEDAKLEGTTSLLRMGDKQKWRRTFSGSLAEDLDGVLAHYEYSVKSDDIYEDDYTSYSFTVVAFDLPETRPHLKKLLVQSRKGSLAGPVFRQDGYSHYVPFESMEFEKRFMVFTESEEYRDWVE